MTGTTLGRQYKSIMNGTRTGVYVLYSNEYVYICSCSGAGVNKCGYLLKLWKFIWHSVECHDSYDTQVRKSSPSNHNMSHIYFDQHAIFIWYTCARDGQWCRRSWQFSGLFTFQPTITFVRIICTDWIGKRMNMWRSFSIERVECALGCVTCLSV
jgi:hypothetical protein